MANANDYTEYQVAMRDGYELLTRVWLPEGDGPFHTILERGYEAGWPTHPERFTAAGYAYVGQQSRGTLEGGMFRMDHVDGYDCLDWVVAQQWCNRRVAMYGRSFMGATQWLLAPQQHPNLVAIVPQVVNPDLWERGDRDFGPNPAIDRFDVALRWLDWVVRGIDDGISQEPPIKFFTMGTNEWRTEADWPLPGTVFTPFYFLLKRRPTWRSERGFAGR